MLINSLKLSNFALCSQMQAQPLNFYTFYSIRIQTQNYCVQCLLFCLVLWHDGITDKVIFFTVDSRRIAGGTRPSEKFANVVVSFLYSFILVMKN